ncbi:leucine-rich repeat-containing protein 49-like [Xenia sp. Carnegie-2017]|uniref:leucine-rich repeat-containing protein 49-like n=1 Tax=Xenia sp. Carnegie-2017 TaxID=2897299 RepID=UPI001F0492D0|nr:leucine-rich repeat-containing protein 49-like [Xenia sp. Carnegie-2017]
MFHFSSKGSRSSRVIQKDSANLGLEHSFQARATSVNERPAPKQNSGDQKSAPENDCLIMPSVTNSVIHRSARLRISPNSEQESVHGLAKNTDPPELTQSLQTFRDLNKVQCQVMRPVPAAMTENFSMPAKHRDVVPRLPARKLHDFKHFRDVQSPGDRIFFTEYPSNPGIPVVYRLPEDRHTNPDRLNLDRRKLTMCPVLEGEDSVRLLNFQHNFITKMENLSQLKRLIFLDFYDNHLEKISGLSALTSLRVLMLGKNRIRTIENLDALTNLDVLDLHGNKLSNISNLSHLTELRVLNLAGNDITEVRNIQGMQALAELNLRRNKISTVAEMEHLPNLQRLFLSFNSIQSFDDIKSLSQCKLLCELSLDGNPIAFDVSYKHSILKNISSLRQLDMRRITEEEKRLANFLSKKENDKKKEIGRLINLKMAIDNAEKQWNMFHIKNHSDENSLRPPENTTPELLSQEETLDATICHLAELEGETLYLYGRGSLDAFDRNWGQQATNTVTNIVFKFIDFDEIVSHLGKVQIKFPIVQKLEFSSTNIKSLPQINALAVIKHLESLTISDDNPVTCFHLWKSYLLFRLAHLSLQYVNGVEVSGEDVVKAEKLFGALSHFTTLCLLQSRLLSLLGENKKHQGEMDFEKSGKVEGKHERTLSNEGLGRAGLRYRARKDVTSWQNFSHNFVDSLVDKCTSNHEKTKKVESIYPRLFQQHVLHCIDEMKDLDKFVEKSLQDI